MSRGPSPRPTPSTIPNPTPIQSNPSHTHSLPIPTLEISAIHRRALYGIEHCLADTQEAVRESSERRVGDERGVGAVEELMMVLGDSVVRISEIEV